MQRLLNVFFHWIPLGATIAILGICIYAVAQQNYRQGLNDPQIQMVEDAQTAINSGLSPVEVVGRAPLFDAEKSLAPFIVVYDSNYTPLESSASVGNTPPKPPSGVFEYAKAHGEDRVTWQPNPDTRIALVVRPTKNGFVASGRNMREVEGRIRDIGNKIYLGIIVLLIFTFCLDLIGDIYRRRQMAK